MMGSIHKNDLRSLATAMMLAFVFKCGVPAAWAEETNAAPVPVVAIPAAVIPLTGEQALQKLLEGNARFVAGQTVHPDQTVERRQALAGGQNPFAIVLTCSDSRVAPELVFDQGLGDLFVIRNAGNVLDDHVIGSIEYAVDHLHVPLIIVVGHEKCGAVSAAVAGGQVPGHIHSLTDDLALVIEQTKDLPGDKVDNAVRANAQRTAEILKHVEPIIKAAVSSTNLTIVAARYELGTGKVEILK
ncbi:MAG TPA: carbonic anhydrase [Verrucomicrobiae bacterium]|nr:carbonic anhydrase [Verrucomicrobiae bacterium]